MKRMWAGLVGAFFVAALVVAYGIGRAGAYGIPQSGTLAYSGTLLTFGQPDNNTHLIGLTLYLSSGTQTTCVIGATSITVVNGQFTVPLPQSCVTIVHQNPGLQVQVNIDGTTLGMQALTAVPYAVEADTASNAAPGSQLGQALTTLSGLSSTINTSFSVITGIPDPNTVLLLQGESTPLADTSLYLNQVTVGGDAAQSTAAAKFGSGSIHLGTSSAGYVHVPYTSLFQVASSVDFTYDFWVNLDSNQPSGTNRRFFQFGPNSTDGFGFMFNTTTIYFGPSDMGGPVVTTSLAPLLGTGWHHLAVTRASGTLRLFLDGALQSTQTGWTYTNDVSDNFDLYISTYPTDAGDPNYYYLSGYLDEFRITRGLARWTANFTPPTAPSSGFTSKTLTITNGIVTGVQ